MGTEDVPGIFLNPYKSYLMPSSKEHSEVGMFILSISDRGTEAKWC